MNMYYPMPIYITKNSTSNEVECYAEVTGLNNGEINSEQYAECLQRKEQEDIEGLKFVGMFTGVLILICVIAGWLLSR